MRKFFRLSLLIIFSLFGGGMSVQADTFNLDLTSTSLWDYENSTGLWNTNTGQIQSALCANGDSTKCLDFGNGSDGAFNDGSSASGISVGGSTITINTDDASKQGEYLFSSFNLSAGFTIQVTGSNPLKIRVFGTTTIAGTILLTNSSTRAGANNVASGTPSGGTGVGGGGNGGSGADTTGTPAGASGTPAAGPSRGGSPGTNQAAAGNQEGGGGGCNGTGATNGLKGGAATGGAAGGCPTNQATLSAAFETAFTGGGGGGGGGNYTGQSSSGAGGGAGGGALHITSLKTITLSGTIDARGGAGGANNIAGAGACGGAGGGGSGGSIWLQSADTYSVTGSLNVTGGTGGDSTDGACTGIYNGGNGSNGATRVDTSAGGVGGVNSSLSIAVPATSPTYTIYSKALTFPYDEIELVSATATTAGAGGTITVEFEGSDDGTNWSAAEPAASISNLSDYREIRLKVTIVPNNSTTHPVLSALAIQYDLKELNNLKLSGGFFCLSTSGRGRSSPVEFVALLGFAIFLWIAWGPSRISRATPGSRR